MYSTAQWTILHIIESIWSVVWFTSEISSLSFCLDDLSVDENGVLKSPTIILAGPICPFISSSMLSYVTLPENWKYHFTNFSNLKKFYTKNNNITTITFRLKNKNVFQTQYQNCWCNLNQIIIPLIEVRVVSIKLHGFTCPIKVYKFSTLKTFPYQATDFFYFPLLNTLKVHSFRFKRQKKYLF